MWNEFANDLVTLIKKDGTKFEDIKSNVQPETIFIFNGNLPLEEGDHLIRKLPNNLVENYVVLDRGYYEKFAGEESHYQASVRKESSLPKESFQNINNHFYGHNSRVNVHSQDYSTNIINSLNESNIFEELQKVIQENIKDETEKQDLIQIIDEMRTEQGKPSYIEKYKNFMALAANHMTTLSPFIPMLSQFLTS